MAIPPLPAEGSSLVAGIMRKYIACLLTAALLLSMTGIGLALDTLPEGILYYYPVVSVEPGLSVRSGTELSLTLLPESFPYEPDLNPERDGVLITWYLDVSGDEMIELGHGMSCTTIPMEREFDNGIIHAEVQLDSGSSAFRTVYDDDETWLQLEIDSSGPGNPNAEVRQAGQEGKDTLFFITKNEIQKLEVWMEADGKTIAGQAPGDTTSYLRGGVSFDWRETDAQWTPVTGTLGSAEWFMPTTALEGTHYYVCRGYYDQQQVAGEARFICRTVTVPDYTTVTSPHTAEPGGTVTVTTTYQDELVDPHGLPTRRQVEEWLTAQTGDAAAVIEEMSGMLMLNLPDMDMDNPTENPVRIENITQEYDGADMRYRLSASYNTDHYCGTLTWYSPMVLIHIGDGSGDIPSEDGYLSVGDVFSHSAHLTQDRLADAVREEMGAELIGVEVFRGENLLEPQMWCATDDRIIVRDEEGNEIGRGTLVLRGDVLGTGSMNITQVVRLAQALSGAAPLEGAYLRAGDLNGSGGIDIADLVAEAALLLTAAG